jgi:DnaJ domain
MMSTCSCGEVIGDNGKLCDRCAALALLDLPPGASARAIKDAYFCLVKVWHPDRFEQDAALKKLAEDKFKRINAAYQLLTQPYSPRHSVRQSPPSKASAQPKPAPEPFAGEYHPIWEPRPHRRPIHLIPTMPHMAMIFACALITLSLWVLAVSNTAMGLHLRAAACALGPRDCEWENSDWGDRFNAALVELRQSVSNLLGGKHSPTGEEAAAARTRRTVAPGPPASLPAANTIPVDRFVITRSAATSAGPNQIVLHAGTPVRLRIVYPVSLSSSQIGQAVEWEVVRDVMTNGVVGIPHGARAVASISGLSRLSVAPRISMDIEQVVLPSGLAVPLQAYVANNPVSNSYPDNQALDFYPARKGDDAAVPPGSEVTVFVHGNVALPAAPDNPVPLIRNSASAFVLPDGTPVLLRLTKAVDAEEAAVGDHIAFEVASNVAIDQSVAIRRGTIAWGTVTQAVPETSADSAGKVAVQVELVRLADGSAAKLRGTEAATTPAAGKITTLRTRVTRWLIAPRHANDTVIPEGSELTAYVDGDVPFRTPSAQASRR